MSQDAAMTTMLISASYVTALAVASTSNWTMSPLNPAIALGQITMITFDAHAGELNFSWIFLVFGWLGSLVALLLFEFGFKKAQAAVEARKLDEDFSNNPETLLYDTNEETIN